MKLTKLSFNNLLLVFALLLAGKTSAQCPVTADLVQPKNAVVCQGVDTQFIVYSPTPGVSYAWEVNDGTGWSNISGAPYTGFLTTNLKVIGSPASLTGYQYRARIDKPSCPTIRSNAVTLTVNTSPFVGTSPIDSQICEGNSVSFTVDADGGGLTYQWQRFSGTTWVDIAPGTPYSGVTSKTLLLTAPPFSFNGASFRVRVSGNCAPPATSDSANLVINTAPQVGQQPTGVSECLGGIAKFTTSAQGTALTYQWQEGQGSGWTDLPGALPYGGVYTNQLEILGITAAMNGRQYRCVVRGKCAPADTTTPVQLVVKTSPAIVSVSDLDTLCEGENTTISVIASGSNLQYQWQEDYQGTSGFLNVNDGTVFSGSKTDKLTITGISSAYEGTLYRVLVTGDCPPVSYSETRTIHVIQDKTVIDDPKDTSIVEGGSGIFKVKAIGTAISYQWQVDDGKGFQSIPLNHPNYVGANTDVLQINYAPYAFSGHRYRCLIYGGCNPAPIGSKGALLTMLWPTSVAGINAKNADAIIYPNPATGSELTLVVKNHASKNINTRIIDNMGRTLSAQPATLSSDNSAKIDISALPSGIYSVIIADEQFNTVKTITFTKK